VCLPSQQWTDVGISVFHSFVVIVLWQSIFERYLLFSECVLVGRRENVGAWIRALSVREFLASNQITAGTPYLLPGFSPNDFFLIPKIKEILKGMHFDDTDAIRSNTTEALKAISQNPLQHCFEGWTRRWHRCMASQGEYFEGDHSDIQQWDM
jgi:hypothetical protein